MILKTTREQRVALKSLYDRQLLNDGGPQYKTYKDMRRSLYGSFDGSGCVMVQLWHMWLGIEKDGYTHS